jgi:hypothetical protein
MYRQPMTRILAAIAIPAGVIAATAVPAAARSDTSASFWKPPMPCVAVRAGVFPAGAGFCPDTDGALDWHAIAAALEIGGDGELSAGCPGTPGSADDFVPGSRHMPLC